MSTVSLKEGIPNGAGRPRRRWLKWLIAAVVVALVIIGLVIGLVLGLRNRGESGGGGEETPPPPTPTGPGGSVWQPSAGTSWQIILSQTLKVDQNNGVQPDVDVFDIDMFLHQNNSVISDLHALNKKVICYFSAGTYEPYRPDSYRFRSADMGTALDGWPDEKWLNLSSPDIRNIMANRVQIAQNIGCDAIDPDNMDGYDNKNGLGLTEGDSTNFVQFLAQEASARNLSMGLKNAGAIIDNVINVVQFSVNEQCAEYNECDQFSRFTDQNKPVFHIEYPSEAQGNDGQGESVASSVLNKSCDTKGASRFSTIIKDTDLNGWYQYCDGNSGSTSTT